MKNIISAILLCLPAMCSAAVVSGTVTDTSGRPMPDIAVSDGYTTVLTDARGHYSIDTDKRLGLVFVTTPSGYTPAYSHANRPKFWQLVTMPADEDEQADFVLQPADDRRFAFVALADNQISNRHGEVGCFVSTTVPDVNATLDSLRTTGVEPFVILLGDQAHDCYWKPNRYGLPEAYSDIEKINAPVYSAMGNHDNDPTAMNDIDAAAEWRRHLGPTYYSFDKGGVHFVFLDDIQLVDDSPLKSQDGECVYRNRLSDDQVEWLRSDLARVADKSTPVVLAMHAPLYYFPGSDRVYYIENGAEVAEILEPFEHVEVISGHTHVSYGAESESGHIHETNYGAVCGSWWLNARIELGNDNNLCRDGTPSGYAIWEWNGSDFRNVFKGTGLPTSAQMRAYDLNMVEFDNDQLAPEFATGRKKTNEILVNVWGYGPGWTVEMSENGKPLEVERVRMRDPLYLISCPIPYIAQGRELIGTVRPVYTLHMFKARAKKSNSPVTIKVTDRYGREYTRTMQRPQALTTDMIQ